MSTFLDKLNVRLKPETEEADEKPELKEEGKEDGKEKGKGKSAKGKKNESSLEKAEEEKRGHELPCDVVKTDAEVVIIANFPGVALQDFDIVLDRENDILTLQASRKYPEKLPDGTVVIPESRTFIQRECKWDPFFRKITLPAEVDAAGATAISLNGLVVIRLPILKLKEGKKLAVVDYKPKEQAKEQK